MASFTNICFVFILCLIFVSNVESEQPPNPSESTPTINMTCRSESTTRLIAYCRRSEFKKFCDNNMSTLLTCKFTSANVDFKADVLLFGSPTRGAQDFTETVWNVLYSKLEAIFSPHVFENLHLLARSYVPKSNHHWKIQKHFINLRYTPFSLSGFPQVKLYFADITDVAPVQKVESDLASESNSVPEVELTDSTTTTSNKKVPSVNFKLTCKGNADLLKMISLITFKSETDFMKLFEPGDIIGSVSLDSLIASKFSFSNCAIWTDYDDPKDSNDQQKPFIKILLDNASQLKNFLKLFNTIDNSAENVKPGKPFSFYVLTFVCKFLEFVVCCLFLDPIFSILERFVTRPIFLFTFFNLLFLLARFL